jgi:phenylpropionate dioxygenase-like ring-hydroxylating dioxygenase large terminal subunit
MPIRHPEIFNHADRFVEGWYWAIASRQLKRGQVKPVTLQGRELALYRGQDGQVVALDAYCPHMGAHLAEGKVEGNDLRCFFHNWKFDATGHCIEMPAVAQRVPACVKRWPTAEQYGLVWVWTGSTPKQPPPFVPELEHEAWDSALGARFVKNCHPNVVMINAIDAHHFNTVHHLPLEVVFQPEVIHRNAIAFHNITRGGEESLFIKLIRPFYQKAVTYSMCYWYGSTGSVTVGPDFLHFYILFALRMLPDGKAEGQTLLVTKRRSGWLGWLANRLILWLTQQVGNYFAKGDTRIFQTIRFGFQTPTEADRSIIQFIQHVEQQTALQWGTWQPQAQAALGFEPEPDSVLKLPAPAYLEARSP